MISIKLSVDTMDVSEMDEKSGNETQKVEYDVKNGNLVLRKR